MCGGGCAPPGGAPLRLGFALLTTLIATRLSAPFGAAIVAGRCLQLPVQEP